MHVEILFTENGKMVKENYQNEERRPSLFYLIVEDCLKFPNTPKFILKLKPDAFNRGELNLNRKKQGCELLS